MKWNDSQGVRFLLAGAANTLAGYVLYLALNLFLDYRVAYTASYLAGILISFVVNSLYVFRQPLRWRRLVVYPLVYVLQFATGLAIVWLFVDVLRQPEALAPLVAVALTLPATYFATRFILKDSAHGPTDH